MIIQNQPMNLEKGHKAKTSQKCHHPWIQQHHGDPQLHPWQNQICTQIHRIWEILVLTPRFTGCGCGVVFDKESPFSDIFWPRFTIKKSFQTICEGINWQFIKLHYSIHYWCKLGCDVTRRSMYGTKITTTLVLHIPAIYNLVLTTTWGSQ